MKISIVNVIAFASAVTLAAFIGALLMTMAHAQNVGIPDGLINAASQPAGSNDGARGVQGNIGSQSAGSNGIGVFVSPSVNNSGNAPNGGQPGGRLTGGAATHR